MKWTVKRTCVISWVVISMACSSSLLSSSVGRFMCLSWSKARSFIFCWIRVISYWIWEESFGEIFFFFLHFVKKQTEIQGLPHQHHPPIWGAVFLWLRWQLQDPDWSRKPEPSDHRPTKQTTTEITKNNVAIMFNFMQLNEFCCEGKRWRYLVKLLMWERIQQRGREEGRRAETKESEPPKTITISTHLILHSSFDLKDLSEKDDWLDPA